MCVWVWGSFKQAYDPVGLARELVAVVVVAEVGMVVGLVGCLGLCRVVGYVSLFVGRLRKSAVSHQCKSWRHYGVLLSATWERTLLSWATCGWLFGCQPLT